MKKYKAGQILTIQGKKFRINKLLDTSGICIECGSLVCDYCDLGKKSIPRNCNLKLIRQK